jgi:hypothetical protein
MEIGSRLNLFHFPTGSAALPHSLQSAGAAPLELPYASSGDGKISSFVVISSIVSNDGLEIAIAFPTVPNMMDLPLISILGPFGCNQFITALSALHPEVGTAMGRSRHDNLSAFASR